MKRETVTRMQVTYYQENIPKTLEEFRSWKFTSGSTAGADFLAFADLFKQRIKRSLPAETSLANFSRGHYYVSGFVQYKDRYIYFSISDVRFFPGQWHSHILVRTAESDKDYTGGSNNYTTLEKLGEKIGAMLQVEVLQEALI